MLKNDNIMDSNSRMCSMPRDISDKRYDLCVQLLQQAFPSKNLHSGDYNIINLIQSLLYIISKQTDSFLHLGIFKRLYFKITLHFYNRLSFKRSSRYDLRPDAALKYLKDNLNHTCAQYLLTPHINNIPFTLHKVWTVDWAVLRWRQKFRQKCEAFRSQ